jgi:hypothetical protein
MGRLLLFYVVPLVLTIFCLVDAITSRDDDVRHVPKLWWLILILLFPVVGSVAWLVAGRPTTTTRAPRARERPAPERPRYERPGRAAADPVAEAEFLERVRERAEEQRRRHEQQRREREAGERPPEGDETATEG